jgi:hypothetical protein
MAGPGKELSQTREPARVPEAIHGNRDFRHMREVEIGAMI